MATGSGKWARRRAMLLGGAIAVVFGGALYLALTASSGLPGASGTVVRATFDDVGALRAGDDVRIANVRVGQVSAIDLVDGKPRVTMRLDDDRQVFRDASAVTASVGARSALGQKYVDLNPGDPKAGKLDSAAVIPATKTVGAQELSDVLAVLDAPTRQALGSTVREVGGGAAGHVKDFSDAAGALPAIVPDLGTVSRALSAGSGQDLTRLLQVANHFAGGFSGRQQQLGELAGRLDTTLRALDADNGKPLSDTMDRAPGTLEKVRGALRDLHGPLSDTEAAVTALRPGANALGKATPDVRGVLRESIPPLQRVPGVADQAQPAVGALTGTLADARPLAPLLTSAVTTARKPLEQIAPYSPEISEFFSDFADAMKYGDAAGHFLRIYTPIDTESVTGLVGLKDPTAARDPYAPPGTAGGQRRGSAAGTTGAGQ
ncbi:MAG TPA: MlaD family protein [Amycolatopsis sp.]|uniref:MlaD family protein n=1 Tax=unclassified Amycolatopsis TaxID=2618356 RepID=UPI00106EEDB2|nr:MULTISPECIES: MlaD family protein [unclassified Amycolatopsis]HWD05777.1 MlaD family protein [Amycolatopsis sp.]